MIAFFRWFSLHSDAIALVALDENDEPCGYVVGAPLGYEKSLSHALVFAAAAGLACRPWLLFDVKIRRAIVKRTKLMLGIPFKPSLTPLLPAPAASLVGLGTREDMRQRGIAKALMEAFETQARDKNMLAMRLSVYPFNLPARRLYARFRWQPFVESLAEDVPMFYFKKI
jgi:GNAT superfamily N-acetyltransferase